MQESTRLDAFLYDKKNIITADKWALFIIQQTFQLFLFFTNLLCLRLLSWRRYKGRDAGLAWWRSPWGIDQSETSLHAGLT